MFDAGLRKVFIYNFLFIISFLILIIYISIGSLGTTIIQTDKAITYEFGEFDILFACKINNCSYIKSNNKYFKLKNKDEMELTNGNFSKIFYFNDKVFLTKNLQIEISFDKNTSIFISFRNFIKRVFQTLSGIFPLFLIFDLYIIIVEYNKVKLLQRKKYAQIHSYSYNHSLMVLVENLNHEIQTPLKVLDFKIKKINYNIDHLFKFINSFNKSQCDIKTDRIDINKTIKEINIDMRLVDGALDHLWNILKKLKNYKQIKEESKTIGELIELSLDLFLVTQSEKFKYKIHKDLFKFSLKDYKIDSGSLTSIIINLAKNSLEHGNSSFLEINYSLDKEMLNIIVTDDGNGISEKIINKIFKENFSTSSSKLKGNGLFINNVLLEDKGTIKLVSSKPGETIFIVSLFKNRA